MIPVLYLCVFYFLPLFRLKNLFTDALTFKIVAIVYLIFIILLVPILYLIYLNKQPTVDAAAEALKNDQKSEEERKHDKNIAELHLAFSFIYLFVLFLIYFISAQCFQWDNEQLFKILMHSAPFLFICDFANARTCTKINYIIFEFCLLAIGTIIGLLIICLFEEVFWIIIAFLIFLGVIFSNILDGFLGR